MILNKIEQNIRVKIHVANKADVRPRSVGLKATTTTIRILKLIQKCLKMLNI